MLSQESRRQVRYAFEAGATHEELIERAIELHADGYGWPRRKYRVEGTYVGNSRLLYLGEAQATQRRYGGHIVQVIPSTRFWMVKDGAGEKSPICGEKFPSGRSPTIPL